VLGRVLDPGQVLHLIDDVDAVGARPDVAVEHDPPHVDRHDPHRNGGERDQHPQLEPVEPRAVWRYASRRDIGRRTAVAAVDQLDFKAHWRATLTRC
jgi:hypothetical protein